MDIKGEEGAWMKDGGRVSGTVEKKGGDVRVSWPYGSVTMPQEAPPRAPASDPRKLRAWTKGQFSVRYALFSDGDVVRARDVRVRVKNSVCYLARATPRLEEHEAMHRLINNTGAARMQETLSAFQTPGPNLKQAEARFHQQFQNLVEKTDHLHKDWDHNHKVR